jgi:hypothetical protein
MVINMDNKTNNTRNKTRARSIIGIGAWLCVGVVIGLMMFDDLALSIGVGAGIGIALGTGFGKK